MNWLYIAIIYWFVGIVSIVIVDTNNKLYVWAEKYPNGGFFYFVIIHWFWPILFVMSFWVSDFWSKH